jgi:hypothetical protein
MRIYIEHNALMSEVSSDLADQLHKIPRASAVMTMVGIREEKIQQRLGRMVGKFMPS